jgi:general stress protein 26
VLLLCNIFLKIPSPLQPYRGFGIGIEFEKDVKIAFVMLNLSDLRFLQEKIQDLKQAIFFSENTSLLRMATTIISISKVDELGQMWFFIPRPQQALHEFDHEFPVRLEFFKKGRQYFLHVSGKAFIVTDPEEVNGLVHDDIRKLTGNHLVLIKVRMLKADYFESTGDQAHPAGWWRDLRMQVYAWLFNTRPRVARLLNP